jgi:hypothetical protein
MPKLPIPQLKQTCARLLDTVKPLLSQQEVKEAGKQNDELTSFSAAVAEFESGLGVGLHKALVERDRAQPYNSYGD